ncbi:MAG TPA: hypothetical protein VN372_00465 [Methanospirillum sp.]|nr:hypothetical protein [Methanospirillum sp.]
MIAGETIIPASGDSVRASSSVANMQNVALESSVKASMVGEGGAPAALKYSFSLGAANKTSMAGAVGMARTEFSVITYEGRNLLLNESSHMEWKDKTEVTGTIINLRKNFDYASGIRL